MHGGAGQSNIERVTTAGTTPVSAAGCPRGQETIIMALP
jgi:hypothetical protein